MGWVQTAQPTFRNVMTDNFSYELTQASLADLTQLGEMEKSCFPQDAWPLVEQIAALMLPGLVRIKAVRDGRMIGFIGGEVKRSQGVGWITTLAVLPEFRGHGVGESLLNTCEQTMGMPYVKLSVRQSNIHAQALYLKCGYHFKDVWRGYYDGGEDALVMEKCLPQFDNVGLL